MPAIPLLARLEAPCLVFLRPTHRSRDAGPRHRSRAAGRRLSCLGDRFHCRRDEREGLRPVRVSYGAGGGMKERVRLIRRGSVLSARLSGPWAARGGGESPGTRDPATRTRSRIELIHARDAANFWTFPELYSVSARPPPPPPPPHTRDTLPGPPTGAHTRWHQKRADLAGSHRHKVAGNLDCRLVGGPQKAVLKIVVSGVSDTPSGVFPVVFSSGTFRLRRSESTPAARPPSARARCARCGWGTLSWRWGMRSVRRGGLTPSARPALAAAPFSADGKDCPAALEIRQFLKSPLVLRRPRLDGGNNRISALRF